MKYLRTHIYIYIYRERERERERQREREVAEDEFTAISETKAQLVARSKDWLVRRERERETER